MARTGFQIESVFQADGRAYVIARLLDPAARFDVSPDATLGGFPVERWLDLPRALDANGQQRIDLFGFCLKSATDLDRLEIGQRVELKWWDEGTG
jgi:hypothetical protein